MFPCRAVGLFDGAFEARGLFVDRIMEWIGWGFPHDQG